MTHPAVTIQVNPTSAPSTPSWMGEVAALAHVLTHVGLLNAIQDHVPFARARFGQYDTIDFVVVLLGYALSGEATLESFYERLAPFADVFMALFEEDLLQRTPPFPSAFRGVGSVRSTVRGRGCRWHQTGGSPTSSSPPSIASIASSSF